MARAKRYNWHLMGVTPEWVLEAAPYWRFRGQELPEGVDWTQTPQGARFWYLAFLKGDLRAEAALGRMLRQAGDDRAQIPSRGAVPAYDAPAYDVGKLAISPDHILVHRDTLYLVRVPPMGINWISSPQGSDFWYAYFAAEPALRDRRVIDCFLAAVERAKRLKGGNHG